MENTIVMVELKDVKLKTIEKIVLIQSKEIILKCVQTPQFVPHSPSRSGYFSRATPDVKLTTHTMIISLEVVGIPLVDS